jgi:hypothetical protein
MVVGGWKCVLHNFFTLSHIAMRHARRQAPGIIKAIFQSTNRVSSCASTFVRGGKIVARPLY